MRSAHGLRLDSDLPLFELPSTDGYPNVEIRLGRVAPELPGAVRQGLAWQAAPGALVLDVHGVARFAVTDGARIVIDRCPTASEEDVRTFLLGSPLGALLQQRGFLVLHASAIATARGAVLFAGRSGVGKSTLLAEMLRRGYAMLADDVTALQRTSDGMRVLPAIPERRLRSDAARWTGTSVTGARHVRGQLDHHVLREPAFSRQAAPCHAIYVLSSHNRPDLVVTHPPRLGRIGCLLRHTYRRDFLAGFGLQRRHLDDVTALSGEVTRFAEVARPMAPLRLVELADQLEAAFT